VFKLDEYGCEKLNKETRIATLKLKIEGVENSINHTRWKMEKIGSRGKDVPKWIYETEAEYVNELGQLKEELQKELGAL
jgi:hypothetical protein